MSGEGHFFAKKLNVLVKNTQKPKLFLVSNVFAYANLHLPPKLVVAYATTSAGLYQNCWRFLNFANILFQIHFIFNLAHHHYTHPPFGPEQKRPLTNLVRGSIIQLQ